MHEYFIQDSHCPNDIKILINCIRHLDLNREKPAQLFILVRMRDRLTVGDAI